jgi:alpha-L-fucosidase
LTLLTGESVDREGNRLASMACLPVNKQWFWKEDYPSSPVKSANTIVESNLIPLNRAYCNFILNVAPNRQGLIDDNALALLKEIGDRWKPEGNIFDRSALGEERPGAQALQGAAKLGGTLLSL